MKFDLNEELSQDERTSNHHPEAVVEPGSGRFADPANAAGSGRRCSFGIAGRRSADRRNANVDHDAVGSYGRRWAHVEQRAQALERGVRLDEAVPGTGLGLAIVQDLAALYGGQLDLEPAGLGGLRAVLTLPAATPQ